MTRILVEPGFDADLRRIVEHLQAHDAACIEARLAELVRAIEILADSPWIGRPAEHELRELVVGRRAHGCVVLYRYDEAPDLVTVLAVRSQRELWPDDPAGR